MSGQGYNANLTVNQGATFAVGNGVHLVDDGWGIANQGTVAIDEGAVLELAGYGYVCGTGAFNIGDASQGTLLIDQNSSIDLRGSTLSVGAYGTLTIASGSSLEIDGSISGMSSAVTVASGGGYLVVEGTLSLEGGMEAWLSNGGEIDVNGGSVEVDAGGISSSGTIRVYNGGSLEVSGDGYLDAYAGWVEIGDETDGAGYLTLDGDSSYSAYLAAALTLNWGDIVTYGATSIDSAGYGAYTWGGGAITLNGGTWYNYGALNITAFNYGSGDVQGSTITINGGEFYNESDASLTFTTSNTGGGTAEAGALVVSSGAFYNYGQLTFGPGISEAQFRRNGVQGIETNPVDSMSSIFEGWDPSVLSLSDAMGLLGRDYLRADPTQEGAAFTAGGWDVGLTLEEARCELLEVYAQDGGAMPVAQPAILGAMRMGNASSYAADLSITTPGGLLEINGGTMTNSYEINLNSTEVAISGSGYLFNWNGGDLAVDCSGGGYVNVNSGGLQNDGTIELSGSGYINVYDGGTFNNESDGALTISDGGLSVDSASYAYNYGAVNISDGGWVNLSGGGYLYTSGSDGIVYIGNEATLTVASWGGGLVINEGTLTNDDGTLEVTDGGRLDLYGGYAENDGALTIDTGGALDMEGGELVNNDYLYINDFSGVTVNSSASVQNNAWLVLNDRPTQDFLNAITSNWFVSFTHDVDISGLTLSGGNYEVGDSEFGGSATNITVTVDSGDLTLSDANLMVDSGCTLNLDGSQAAETLNVSVGGDISGYGTIVIGDGINFTWTGTNLSDVTLTVAAEGTLNVQPTYGSTSVEGITLQNAGTINWLDGDPGLAPTELSAWSSSLHDVSLSWSYDNHLQDGVVIERSDDGGVDFYVVDSVADPITSYDDTSGTPGVEYIYRVCGAAGSFVTTASDGVTVTAEAYPGSMTVAPVNVSTAQHTDFVGTVGTFTDPGSDAITDDYWATIDWGDGSTSYGAVTYDSGTFTVTGEHTYDSNGTFTTSLVINRDDGAEVTADSKTASVTWAQATLSLDGDSTLNEGDTYVLSISSDDPDLDASGTWTVDWGDGTDADTFTGNPQEAAHTYVDNAADPYVITVTADDGTHDSASATQEVTVQDVPPVLTVAGEDQVFKNTSYELDLNVTDPGTSDTLSDWTIDWGDGSGASTVSASDFTDGSATTTHIYADAGDYSIYAYASATSSDDTGTFDSNTFNVQVLNRLPIAYSDSYTMTGLSLTVDAADGVINLQSHTAGTGASSDYDPDGDTLTAVKVANPAYGSVTLSADGSFAYTAGAGFAGSDSFTYKVTDGTLDAQSNPVYSNLATVTITGPVSVANDDTVSWLFLYSGPANVLADDVIVGTVTPVIQSPAQHGTASLSANGTLTYTYSGDFQQDAFTYRLESGSWHSNTATVYLEGPGYPYIDYNPAMASTSGDAVTINLLESELSVQGLYSWNYTPGISGIVTSPSHGTVVDHHDGTFTYTPNAGYAGLDSFSFTATATASGLPTLTVTGLHVFINCTSTVTPDNVLYSLYQGQTLSVSAEDSVLNRSDSSDNLLDYTLFGPDGSTLTGTSQGGDMVYTTAGGTLTVYADRSYDYTANGDFVGRDNIGFCFGSTYDSAKPLGAIIFDSDQIRPELIIDGDNNDGYGLPDGTLIEHADSTDPDRSGKTFAVNDGDLDQDGIPDYAEITDVAGQPFVPMEVVLPSSVDLTGLQLTFTYDASQPFADLSTDGLYTPAHSLRLWTKSGDDSTRTVDDFVDTDTPIDASSLEFTTNGSGQQVAVLYVEAVAAANSASITLSVSVDTTDSPSSSPTINGQFAPAADPPATGTAPATGKAVVTTIKGAAPTIIKQAATGSDNAFDAGHTLKPADEPFGARCAAAYLRTTLLATPTSGRDVLPFKVTVSNEQGLNACYCGIVGDPSAAPHDGWRYDFSSVTIAVVDVILYNAEYPQHNLTLTAKIALPGGKGFTTFQYKQMNVLKHELWHAQGTQEFVDAAQKYYSARGQTLALDVCPGWIYYITQVDNAMKNDFNLLAKGTPPDYVRTDWNKVVMPSKPVTPPSNFVFNDVLDHYLTPLGHQLLASSFHSGAETMPEFNYAKDGSLAP